MVSSSHGETLKECICSYYGRWFKTVVRVGNRWHDTLFAHKEGDPAGCWITLRVVCLELRVGLVPEEVFGGEHALVFEVFEGFFGGFEDLGRGFGNEG